MFLNPLESKATPAKERTVFLFILIQFIVLKPIRANLSLRKVKDDSCHDSDVDFVNLQALFSGQTY